jgi:hypothetical protein
VIGRAQPDLDNDHFLSNSDFVSMARDRLDAFGRKTLQTRFLVAG